MIFAGRKNIIMSKMRARVLTSVGNLEMKTVDVPEIKSGEVLLKVHACGICGSDIPRIFTTGTYHFPTIPGHEFAGEVVDAYDDRDKKLIGMRAAVFPLIPCRECNSCQKGVYELCAHYNYLGSRTDGAFAEYVAVPVWNLAPIPDNVSYEQAAMCEPVSVALHALRQAKIEVGDSVVIYGPGTIGLLIAQWAKAWGASHVMMVGTDHTDVEFLKSIGIYDFCNGKREDSAQWVSDLTGGVGADIAIEAVGAVDALCNCLNSVAPGGKIICVGNPRGDFTRPKDTYWKILRKQIVMYGTWNSSFDNSTKNDWKIAIDAMSKGIIQNEKLITHRFSLEDMDKGLDIMKNSTETYHKIIVKP